ncbi:MAG: glycosyltransferase family 1 protein [Bacteroidota bacterium]
MRIAFDAKRLYNNFTGLGNYSRTLVSNLVFHFPENNYHLFSPKLKQNEETLPFLNHPKLNTHLSSAWLKAYWRSFSIKEDLRQKNIQIYHGLSHEIPFGIQKTGIKSVVTIHDLIIRRYPEYFPFLDRQIYNQKFRYACEQADRIIAISKNTKKDIINYYQIPASKIQVIYQTCHERFKQIFPATHLEKIRLRYQLPNHFLLYVGSIIPRKHLKEIVEAVALLPDDLQIPLVVVGDGKAYKKEVVERISSLQMTSKVYFLNPQYADLPAIYQLAQLFIYPSAYEGFGLPILEALYAQTPVIAARTSSLPEAGGEGAYYVDEISAERLAAAITLLLEREDAIKTLVRKGQQHLSNFSSVVLSRQLMELYEAVMQ